MRDGNLPWFALHVRSSRERLLETSLRNKGYETFLPTAEVRRHWSDRIRKVQTPLFPGYLFCRFDPNHRLSILTCPGLIQIVGRGKAPVPVDESEITAIRAVVRSKLEAGPWPHLETGDRVRIEDGPLRGLEGILLDSRSDCRLVVSVTLLQRSIAVVIERDWVMPAGRTAISLRHLSFSAAPGWLPQT